MHACYAMSLFKNKAIKLNYIFGLVPSNFEGLLLYSSDHQNDCLLFCLLQWYIHYCLWSTFEVQQGIFMNTVIFQKQGRNFPWNSEIILLTYFCSVTLLLTTKISPTFLHFSTVCLILLLVYFWILTGRDLRTRSFKTCAI